MPTLRANQHQRQVRRVPVGGEAAEVVVDGLEADLVLKAEDEDYGVHPQRKLHTHNHNNNNTTLYTSQVSSCVVVQWKCHGKGCTKTTVTEQVDYEYPPIPST